MTNDPDFRPPLRREILVMILFAVALCFLAGLAGCATDIEAFELAP